MKSLLVALLLPLLLSASPFTCPANSKIQYSKEVSTLGSPDLDTLVTECSSSSSNFSCTAEQLVKITATAVAKDGMVRAACPLSITRGSAQFGVDAADDFKPVYFRVRFENLAFRSYAVVDATATLSRRTRRQAVSGDFRKVSCNGSTVSDTCKGFIQNADGSTTEQLTIFSNSDFTAVIQYEAEESFRPAALSFTVNSKARSIPFALPDPAVESTVTFAGPYTSNGVPLACGSDPDQLVLHLLQTKSGLRLRFFAWRRI